MNVHKSLQDLPSFSNAVVTIGTFDGVHIGHQQIIQQLKATAATVKGETVIITFHPHPRSIVGSFGGSVSLLNTLEEKIELLEKAGINHLVVVPFTETFANQTAEEYCTNFLYHYFKPHTIIIGYDHRFGKNRSGDYTLLETMAQQLGFAVKEIDEQILNAVTVSSTKIRKALLEQDITTANTFLGYPYFFSGLVIKGNQLGRTIGFATANLLVKNEEKLIVANGVYAVTVNIKLPTNKTLEINSSSTFKGMMNIGTRPTVDGKIRSIEVHIFDFDSDIYGEALTIQLYQFIRGEVKFNGLVELTTQLKKDEIVVREILNTVGF